MSRDNRKFFKLRGDRAQMRPAGTARACSLTDSAKCTLSEYVTATGQPACPDPNGEQSATLGSLAGDA